MAPGCLSGGNVSPVKYFEVRVDEDHLVLRGTPQEASNALLKGNLVLCNSEPLKANGIYLRFKGKVRTCFTVDTANGTKSLEKLTTIVSKTWNLGTQNPNKKHQNIIPAGNHEWSFEMVIMGDLPESIEGLHCSWIVYRMKATIDRGLFTKNIEARRHIRLIRTFELTALEPAYSTSINETWPNKIKYDISTPVKSVVFGTRVRVDFVLIPQVKGLRIGKIDTSIVERQEVVVQLSYTRSKKAQRIVAQDSYEIPEHIEAEDIDGEEGFKVTRYLQLPRRLTECLQSVEERNIFINHIIKFSVRLLNPEGHVSEIRACLPLQIFISPDVRLNDQNELTNDVPTSENIINDLVAPPPSYSEYSFDPLYEGLDTRGFITPGPGTPFDRSRRGSLEDLESLAQENEELSANTLRNRLTNLDLGATDRFADQRSAGSNFNTLAAAHSGSPSRINSSPDLQSEVHFEQPHTSRGHRSAPASGRTSPSYLTPPESGSRSPNGFDSRSISGSPSQTRPSLLTPLYSESQLGSSQLSRVPSYNTAMHSDTKIAYKDDLPDYFSATIRPPSPPDTNNRDTMAGITIVEPHRSSSAEHNTSASTGIGDRGRRHAHFADDVEPGH